MKTAKPKTPTSISVDQDVINEAKALFSMLGLNLSSAINVFLIQCIRERAIPFRIALSPDEALYNPETLRTIKEVRSGIGLSGPYSSVKELMEDLHDDEDGSE